MGQAPTPLRPAACPGEVLTLISLSLIWAFARIMLQWSKSHSPTPHRSLVREKQDTMTSLIFDAGPLITVCKFNVAGRPVIDHILERCKITVASSVRDEVVIASANFPDAMTAQQRIEGGWISVVAPPSEPELEALISVYGLSEGERESILLTEHADLPGATLVIDDHLAYLVSDRLGRQKRFLLDVIVDLVNARDLDRDLAIEMVNTIRTRYPPAFVEHSMLLLQR